MKGLGIVIMPDLVEHGGNLATMIETV